MTDTSGATGSSSENGTGTENGDAAAQAAAAAAAAAGDQNANGEQPPANGENGDQNSPWDDPAKARAEIERLRRENGDQRINAKKAAADEARKELLTELTKLIDPNAANGDTPPSVEAVTEQLANVQGERDTARAEAAIVREAWKLGVDPAKVDYLTFVLGRNAEFGALDPTSGDYAAKLSAVISSEIAKDSSLKPSGTAASTSVEQHGGAGATSTITKAEFDAMSYGQRVELFRTNRSEYDRLAAG